MNSLSKTYQNWFIIFFSDEPQKNKTTKRVTGMISLSYLVEMFGQFGGFGGKGDRGEGHGTRGNHSSGRISARFGGNDTSEGGSK